MKYFTYSLLVCLLGASFGCAKAEEPDLPLVNKYKSANDSGVSDSDSGSSYNPDAVDPDISVALGDHLNYHGGSVITETANVYLIWYGDFNGGVTQPLISDFVNGFSDSEYYKIISSYYENDPLTAGPSDVGFALGKGIGGRFYAADSVKLIQSINEDKSVHGSSLSLSDIKDIVEENLTSKKLPMDENGVYVVLTDPDVQQTAGLERFCMGYCGWHTHFTMNDMDIKYAFVGDPMWCPDACAPEKNGLQSPSGNVGADAMVSVLAHELGETITDPSLNGWYSNVSGEENGDLCAWSFGDMYPVSNGSYANMKIGGHDFLIQENWVNSDPGGYCALHL